MIVGHTVLVNCTRDMTTVSLILKTLAGLTYVGEVAIFIWTGPFEDNVLFKVLWDFIFEVHKDGFKGVGSFEDDLYAGMLKNSSEFFTEAKNTWDTDEDILLISKPVSGFTLGVVGFFSGFLMIQSR